jgi:hypothetical protein
MRSVLLDWSLEAEHAKTLALWLRLMSNERRGRIKILDVLRERANSGSKRRQGTETLFVGRRALALLGSEVKSDEAHMSLLVTTFENKMKSEVRE